MLVHAYPRVEDPAPKLKRSSNSPSVLPPPFSTSSGATNPFSQPDAAAPPGWKFVFGCAKPDKPYQAKLKVSTGPNKCFQEHLGYFGSAPEAALAVARRLGPAGLSGLKRKRD